MTPRAMDAVWFLMGFISCLLWLYFIGQDGDDDDDDMGFT